MEFFNLIEKIISQKNSLFFEENFFGCVVTVFRVLRDQGGMYRMQAGVQ